MQTTQAAQASDTIRIGTAGEFAAVRALFARASYDEATVARRMGGSHLFGFPRLGNGRQTVTGPVEDVNAALIRLLLDGEPLPAAQVEQLCGGEATEALRSLGVLVADPADAGALHATIMLVPLEGMWLASDIPPFARRPRPGQDLPDLVFPPANELTRQFLEVIPDAPGQRVVELCAGSGVAALRALARGAAEAWQADVAPRSVHFAQFNAALNVMPSVVSVVSDGWDALAGETFDRVYAHPPYVPALATEFVYRDGGSDGEHVTRAIIAGLPAHLRAGGACSITCALTDRRDEPAERRVMGWLGDAASEFELVVFQRSDWDVMHAYRNVGGEGVATFRDCERWLRHFDALGIERFVLCSFELRRTGRRPGRAAGGAIARRIAGPRLAASALDWEFRWAELVAAHPDPVARLTARAPRIVPHARLEVALVADEARDWHTRGATVSADWPANAAVHAPPLAPTLLELCDGTRDLTALLGALRDAGLVDESVSRADLARLLELMCAAGILELPDCPVPPKPAAPGAWPRQSGAQTRTTATSSVPTQSTRQ